MRYRLLGSVEVTHDGTVVPIVRRRERCLLGLLLLEIGRFISVDRLIYLLWEGDEPEHARRSVYTHVARIRATLDRAGAGVLASSGAGYAMKVDPDQVDLHRFRTLVTAARGSEDPAHRVARLEEALGLWRGDVMQGSASAWLRERVFSDVEALRIDAAEELLTAALHLGQHQSRLPVLAHLSATYPAREGFAALYMTALHRAGRDAEALSFYSRVRTYLCKELGLDPGRRLRDLQRAILRQEETEDPLPPAIPRPAPWSVGPAGLPVARAPSSAAPSS
jgi:DNA-binding SARP family transcriptional activator